MSGEDSTRLVVAGTPDLIGRLSSNGAELLHAHASPRTTTPVEQPTPGPAVVLVFGLSAVLAAGAVLLAPATWDSARKVLGRLPVAGRPSALIQQASQTAPFVLPLEAAAPVYVAPDAAVERRQIADAAAPEPGPSLARAAEPPPAAAAEAGVASLPTPALAEGPTSAVAPPSASPVSPPVSEPPVAAVAAFEAEPGPAAASSPVPEPPVAEGRSSGSAAASPEAAAPAGGPVTPEPAASAAQAPDAPSVIAEPAPVAVSAPEPVAAEPAPSEKLPEAKPAVVASLAQSEPRSFQTPGLLLVARPGDTLQRLYRSVYSGVRAPPYPEVVEANPSPVRPGVVLMFPTPPDGWRRP